MKKSHSAATVALLAAVALVFLGAASKQRRRRAQCALMRFDDFERLGRTAFADIHRRGHPILTAWRSGRAIQPRPLCRAACNPSRAAVFSGPPALRGRFLSSPRRDPIILKFRPDLVLIPQHFKHAGYRHVRRRQIANQKHRGLFGRRFSFPTRGWSPSTQKQVESNG